MRAAILAHDKFGPLTSKTGVCILRYSQEYEAVAVIDRSKAGRVADEFVGPIGKGLPIVASLQDALRLQPEVLILGTAPMGGALPEDWRGDIRLALERKLEVVSGLHTFLADDPELGAIAKRTGAKIWDVRKPRRAPRLATGEGGKVEALVVHTLGTDCNSGKMTTSVEIASAALRRGWKAAFAATGQTGMMIGCDAGAPIDRIVSDFVAGAAEELVIECARKGADLISVEGQGSLDHWAYSGVTLGLLHGCQPDLVVLCHQAGRRFQGEYSGDRQHPIRSLGWHINVIETLSRPVHPTKVCAVSLATFHLGEAEARAAILAVEKETGLPCTDPVRFGPEKLLDAILRAAQTVSKPGVERLRKSMATAAR